MKKLISLSAFILGAVLVSATAHADVTISEIMAKNGTSLTTASGVGEIDWVELHNSGSVSVDLSGWYLGNDPTKKTSKWTKIQGSCVVPANGYKIVWCDGDGLCTDWADDEAHVECNVSTEAGKHTVFLAKDAHVESIVHQVPMPGGFEDVSYGVVPSSGMFGYFPEPTPGAANDTVPRTGVTPAVAFSESHGYKTAPFELALSCPADGSAAIYYTLDGTSPVPGAEGTFLYDGPFTVARTTVVRAAVCDADSILQFDTSATYLFLSDVLTQDANPPAGFPADKAVKDQVMRYGMRTDIVNGDAATRARLANGFTNGIRTVSFVIDPKHLFDGNKGIYVNAQQSGSEWERPMLLEQIFPVDTKDEFSVPCGVRIRGAFSRKPSYPKHGFHLIFRSDYGMSKLVHPLFGEEGAESFDRIDFRTEQNCSWANGLADNSLTHEVFSRDTQRDMGQPYARSRYYHLFINGIYWGVYQSEERASQSYAQSYIGGSESNYDVVRTYNDYGQYYHTGVVDGETEAWSNLWETTINQGYGPDHAANYNRVRGLNPDGSRNPAYPVLLNVTNLVCYMLVSHFAADGDTPATIGGANNIIAYRNRVDGEGVVDGFLFNRHDTEHSLGHGAQGGSYDCSKDLLTYGSKKYKGLDVFDKFNPSALHYELCTNAVYRRTFSDLVQKHVLEPGGALGAKASETRYRARMAEIHDGVMGELARWGGNNNVDGWEKSCKSSIEFIKNRAPYLIKSYRELGWFPSVDAAEFVDRSGVRLSAGTRAVPGDRVYLSGGASGTIHYTTDGSDPCLEGGTVSPKASAYAGGDPEPSYTKVISSGDVWKYSQIGAKPAEDWAATDYDDASWSAGPSPLGFDSKRTFATTLHRYVNNVSGTQIATYYFRNTFNLSEGAEKLTALRAKLDCNDGYIVYLNGVEVCREKAGSSEYDGYSVTYGAVGEKVVMWSFDAGLLHAGENSIAVEVHQYAHARTVVNDGNAWWNLELSVPAPGPVVGGIEVPADGLKLAARVRTAAGEWSALSEIAIVTGEPEPETEKIVFSGVYDEPVEITADASCVFSNATLKAGLVVADGVTAKLHSATNTVNSISEISAAGAEVRFTGDGTMKLEGEDTLATVRNLLVKSGTLVVKSTGVAANKTPVINVLGFVEQTGGVIDMNLDVATTNQIYGIYLANKNTKDAAGEDTVYALFDGGRFNAVVGATKSAAVYGNKGSADATFKGGEILDILLKGVEPRFANVAGKLEFKRVEAKVTMPEACESVTGARVFKSDKKIVFSDSEAHFDVNVPGPDAEIFSAADRITVDAGVFELVASDDCFSATTNITVNGGLIYAVSTKNDVFDSNGDMELNGGTILAYTTAGGHEAFDVDPELDGDNGLRHQLRINGGTIFATGGKGAAWPTDFVTPDGFVLYSAEDLAASDVSGKYASLKSTIDMITTAKLPLFTDTKCALLMTCPNMTGDPTFSASAPSAGSQDFHDLYIDIKGETYQSELRFLEIFGSTDQGSVDAGTFGDVGEYIVLTNPTPNTIQLAGVTVSIAKNDVKKGKIDDPKCLITLGVGVLPAYGSVRLDQADYSSAGWSKITNGNIFLKLTDALGNEVQSGYASFDNAKYTDVDGKGASLIAVSFGTSLEDTAACWYSSRETEPEPPPHEHAWGSPTYSWSADGKSCTASRACSGCTEKETETVTATFVTTKEATTTATGLGHYEASFKNTAFAKQSGADVTIPKKEQDGPVATGDYYVSTTGSDSNNGTSPDTAFATIAHAVEVAAAGQKVCVLEGVYNLTAELVVNKAITIVGAGWSKTVVKQTASCRVITLNGGAKLEGVTLTGGTATSDAGAGALVRNGTISWCCITNNHSTSGSTSGGGVSFSGGTGVIDHSIVTGNSITGSSWGGGIGGKSSTGTVLIDSCLVYGNEDKNGSGGGIGFQNCAAVVTIRNTTVVANKCSNGNGHGLYFNDVSTGGKIVLVNDILTGNVSGSTECNTFIARKYFDGVESRNCLITGAQTQHNADIYKDANVRTLFADQTTVISTAPTFVGDYHLAEGSAGIGAGASYSGIGKDLDGKSFAATPSVGCYEYGTVEPPTETVDWDHPEVTIATGVTAGTAWSALKNSVLDAADAAKLQSWAKNVGKVAFESAGDIKVEAFLLNCANTDAAVAIAKEEFKFTSFDPEKLPTASDFADKGYNGVITIEGRAALESGDWATAKTGDKFFRAVLSL